MIIQTMIHEQGTNRQCTASAPTVKQRRIEK